MANDFGFPKLKKKLSNFLNDEEGTILRSKAAVVGPMAVGTVLLMSKELTMSAEASRYTSHLSHRSHASHSSNASHSNQATGSTGDNSGHNNHANHASHSNTLPAHSSHSSGTTSGFSHTAGTFDAEGRNADNN